MVLNSDFPTFSFPIRHQFAWNPQRIHTRGTGAWVVAVAPRDTYSQKNESQKKKCTSSFCFHEENNITRKKTKTKTHSCLIRWWESHPITAISFALLIHDSRRSFASKIWRTLGTVKVSCLPQRTWANLVSMDVHPFEILWVPIPRSQFLNMSNMPPGHLMSLVLQYQNFAKKNLEVASVAFSRVHVIPHVFLHASSV